MKGRITNPDDMTTIEDRIREAMKALALLHLALNADSEGEDEDVVEAMRDLAFNARQELHWIERLPASVLNLPAPTGDEVSDDKVLVAAIHVSMEQAVARALKAKGGKR
jgi:hypothetical protein